QHDARRHAGAGSRDGRAPARAGRAVNGQTRGFAAMSFQKRISRTGGTKVKRALGVQAALEWAFRIEKAQLDLPPPPDVLEEGFGFGLGWGLRQRGSRGSRIDGGQHKIGGNTPRDAEVLAAAAAGMPDSMGGKRMAIRMAELARAGLTPDWMPGA